jgi:type VI secretion system protein ImpL
MIAWRSLVAKARRVHLDARQVAIALLAAWFVGLVGAAVQLERWQAQLTRTLLQLSADEQFRARVAHRDQVDPQWYRRKALGLLAALEKVRRDTWWTLSIPGSWHRFDDLEERLAARMEREFGDIVLETLRRELFARASRLTNAPLAPGGAAFRAPLECTAPQARGSGGAGNNAEDLPEFAALRDYVASLRELDEAVHAWQALQLGPGDQGVTHLRRLVRYTLDADLPGPMSRSVELFNAIAREAGTPPSQVVAPLQAAARCGLLQGAASLDARLLAQNPLLATEQALIERSAGLFDGRRQEPFVPSVQRLRAVQALLQEQEALLARGGTGWMREGRLQRGPAYQALLEQAEATPLLGPEVVRQVRQQSDAAFAKFRRQFDAMFGRRGEPGLVWDAGHGRYVLSPQRTALRQGLTLLLQQPLMQLRPDGTLEPAPASFDQALATADTRRRLRREVLPALPEFARAPMARLVDARLSLLAHDAAANAIRAAVPQDARMPFDAIGFRAQRAKVAQVQALLVTLGAPDLAQRLGTQQAAELGARLARAQEELRTMPLFSTRAADFSWWRGEPAPLPRALGAADTAALQALLAGQFQRLEALSRDAEKYLQAADGALVDDPAAQAWARLAREVDRYRAHLPDSSMLAMERYLLELGPHLRRENCAENLRAQSPPRHDDEVAQRLTELHNALVQRCLQLRGEGPVAVGN